MVLRIIGSKMCRPSKLHKPKYLTSNRQQSTSSDQRDDEVAKRQQNQKIIDYMFGPPILHEIGSIKVPNLVKKEDGVTLMEGLKEKPMHTKTAGTLGNVHESVQNTKVLPQQEATVDAMDPRVEQKSQRQGQQVEGSIVRAAAKKYEAKQDNLLQKTLPNLNSTYIEGPSFYQQNLMETQMYDNFAKKYLRTEAGQIDKLLAKEMEKLEYKKSVNVPNLRAVDTPDNTGNTPQSQQLCSHNHNVEPEPHQKVDEMTTAKTSIEENLHEIYTLESCPNAHYDELVPLRLTQCLDFYQVHSPPESIVINDPLEKLQLDENLPTHYLLPATLANDEVKEWTDVSRGIIQPIGRPHTIVQFRAQPAPSTLTNPEDKVGAQTHESHRMQETKQPAEVTNKIVNIQIKPALFQEQSNPFTKNLIEANVSEHTKSSKRSFVQVQIVNEQVMAQPDSSTQDKDAKRKQVMKDNDAQQFQLLEDTERIPRTDTMVQSCVHAQTLPNTDQKAKNARSLDDVLADFHLDPNMSLSEVLKRVRAYNRLQYCKEIRMQVLNMSSVFSSKRCPPSDRPQSPPPPDCLKECPPPPKPKPKCPKCPECPPPQKCPPPQPKCPPDPPKCPSTCPPPKKCPGKCGYQSTDPLDSIIVASFAPSCIMIEYIIEKINQGLQKFRKNSILFMTGRNLEAEILQLNRVKDFEPWTPIPSWPYPLEDKKRKLQCPYYGCPVHKPGAVRPQCPPLPCSGFPKRLSFSAI